MSIQSEDRRARGELPVLAVVPTRKRGEEQVQSKRHTGELWTSGQRQMHSLHYAVSYRGSFKPEVPDFCIRRYSAPGDSVLDPFCGRGTTPLQAAMLGRVPVASDANPVATLISQAKLAPVGLDEVVIRLHEINFMKPVPLTAYQDMLHPFYHPDTYRELVNLKQAIKKNPDRVNRFIEMLAISRLHGHSQGFFSVYSFPQISIPPERQLTINAKRRQEPEPRAVSPRIIKKAAQVLRDGYATKFEQAAATAEIHQSDARNLHYLGNDSVDLIVCSPPFLDNVDYLSDNWLELWFSGISPLPFQDQVMMTKNLDEWRSFMRDVLREALRVIRPHSFAIFEVGEVQTPAGTIFLDEILAEEVDRVQAHQKYFRLEEVLINQQNFSKLSHTFQVENNKKGTNSNRLVVLSAVPQRFKR